MQQPTPTVEHPDHDDVEIDDLIAAGDRDACEQWLDRTSASDAVHAIASLSADDRSALVTLLDVESGADLLRDLPESQATSVLESIDPAHAARILETFQSDDRADAINALEEDDAGAILDQMPDHVADDVRRLAAYDDDSAGGLMLTEFVALPEHATIRDVLADMERNAEAYRDYDVQYTYVVDDAGRLRGVLPIRRLLLARRDTPVREVMIADPITARDVASFDDLRATFREYAFIALPVVTDDGVLVGVVRRDDVKEAEADEADEVYRASQGIVGGEELRSMPLLRRSRRRLAWLSANIVLNIVAASVIAAHQDTLEAVIALAVFLPIISDMSGCSGNQAVAVSMRELTLGVTRPRDVARVLMKECSVGVINGIVLGILIGGVAYAWKGDVALSLVVGGALAANTLIAVCIGGGVPLLLKAFRVDPALASGPILTTVTDMCGFLIVLSLASATLTTVAG